MEDVRAFAVHDHGRGVVSFGRADGSVHSSVVTAGVMEHPSTGANAVAFVVFGTAVKLRHWRHTPQANIVFRSDWSWISIEGPVTIIGPDDPIEGFEADVPKVLRDVFTAAGGTHDDWDEYNRVMVAERRAAIFISPNKIRGDH